MTGIATTTATWPWPALAASSPGARVSATRASRISRMAADQAASSPAVRNTGCREALASRATAVARGPSNLVGKGGKAWVLATGKARGSNGKTRAAFQAAPGSRGRSAAVPGARVQHCGATGAARSLADGWAKTTAHRASGIKASVSKAKSGDHHPRVEAAGGKDSPAARADTQG